MSHDTQASPPQGGAQSTAGAVRDQAADVAQSARQAGGQVAGTAAEQAKQVVSEAGRQAEGLLGQARGQARDQASAQQRKAAGQLHTLADELHAMAAKGGQGGLAADLADQASQRMHGAASWLEQREPGDLLNEVRDFARRRPGVFLLGAALAGVAAGRLTRGMTAAAQSGEESAPPDQGRYPMAPAADAPAVPYGPGQP